MVIMQKYRRKFCEKKYANFTHVGKVVSSKIVIIDNEQYFNKDSAEKMMGEFV